MDNQNYSPKDGVTSRLRHAAGAAVVAMSLYLAPNPADAVVRPSPAPVEIKREFFTEQSSSLDYKVVADVMQDAIRQSVDGTIAWVRSLVPYVHSVGQLYANANASARADSAGVIPGNYVVKACLADESQVEKMSLQDLITSADQSQGRISEPGHAYWARRENMVNPATGVIEFWHKTFSPENPCRLWMLRANESILQAKAQSISSPRYEPGSLSMECVPDNMGGYVISHKDSLRQARPDRDFWPHKELALVPCADSATGVASWYKAELVK